MKHTIALWISVWLTGCLVSFSAEGPLDVHLREPSLQKQVLFDKRDQSDQVREPYLAIAADGTVLALRNHIDRQPGTGQLRRSEDGGRHWEDIIKVPFGFLDSNMIIDETTGDILTVRLWDNTDRQWRSSDYGKTWKEEKTTLRLNEVMKRLEQTGVRKRQSSQGERTNSPVYSMHANASESGITLRYGKHKGRLIVTATFRPHAKAHPSDRAPADATYSCAIYSDDHGANWQVSDLFPAGLTEEAALAELEDGRIYYNSRCCDGFFDASRARQLKPEESLRREAWSFDGGETWENLRISKVLPDGGGMWRGYGLKGGLVRLPVKGHDILIYSNADTAGGGREMLTVWASFDGGNTWPVKRLLNAGPSAYSSLGAGRPGTAGEGQIFMLFEGAETHYYHAMNIARFNLAWILHGERTGDGEVPGWLAFTPSYSVVRVPKIPLVQNNVNWSTNYYNPDIRTGDQYDGMPTDAKRTSPVWGKHFFSGSAELSHDFLRVTTATNTAWSVFQHSNFDLRSNSTVEVTFRVVTQGRKGNAGQIHFGQPAGAANLRSFIQLYTNAISSADGRLKYAHDFTKWTTMRMTFENISNHGSRMVKVYVDTGWRFGNGLAPVLAGAWTWYSPVTETADGLRFGDVSTTTHAGTVDYESIRWTSEGAFAPKSTADVDALRWKNGEATRSKD